MVENRQKQVQNVILEEKNSWKQKFLKIKFYLQFNSQKSLHTTHCVVGRGSDPTLLV